MNTSTADIEKQLLYITQQFISESGEGLTHRAITLDASLQRHLGIDSLGRAELFSRIEKQFDIQLPQQLLAEANTLQDIAKAIEISPHHTEFKHSTIVPVMNEVQFDPSSTKTLVDVLLLYAIQTPDRPHIYLQDEYGKEEIISYGKLLDISLRVAHAFQQKGLRPGDTVAIMLPTSPEFFYTLFGVLLAGCIPVPIYPPFRPHQIEAYAKQEAKILQNAEVRLLVTFHEAEKLSRLLRAFIPSLKEVVKADKLLESTIKAPIYPLNGDDFGLIQYTSGSTSAPKGVLLTHQNLLSNIRSFGKAIQVSPSDVAVSWAPLYHDLGLIGMWFGSLYHGIPLTIMSPLTFLTRPERWLWAIHYHRGTISGGPNFAYELCIRKIEPTQIEGLDLSSWRLAVNGAEAIQPQTLENFTKKFSPYGFKAEAHFPVYGLAESTVCVATSPLNRGPRIDVISRDALEKDRQAIPVTNKTNQNTLEVVACGKPIPDHQMRVVDESGNVLPERHIGHLQFKGPSSMQGYYANPDATQAIFQDGWCGTGDLAYIADEEVFITGRIKDLIIKAGRNLYPAEIETLAGQVPHVRKGCVIAFGIQDKERGTEKLIVVAETSETKPNEREKIIEAITDNMVNALDIAPDHVVLVAPRVIPKTSSGKLQRTACKNAYLNGTLSQQGKPAWLQITKLSLSFFNAKIFRGLDYFGKALFTIYVALLFAISFPFIWISLFILPRKMAATICHYWARSLTVLTGCRLRVKGRNNLYTKPVIYTPNHTTYVDAVLVLALLPPDTRFVGKSEIKNMPIMRTFFKKLGHVLIDRADVVKGVEDTQEIQKLLTEGHSVMIFPEGTFSYATGLRPFKLGAFKVSVETGVPICPIAFKGARYILRGEERLLRPHSIDVNVGELIYPQGNDWQSIMQLKNKTRDYILQHCGEPALDLILTGIAQTKNESNEQ